MRIVFMGTPAFAVPTLRRLVAAGYAVVGVYTQPDRPAGRGQGVQPPPVKLVAEELALPVFQPPRLRKPEAFVQLQALRPDAIVVASYGQILRREVLDLPPYRCLNVHASLLPRYRGAAPIPAAILAGDAETGVTIMLIEESVDSGPVLAQAALPIAPTDTTGTLTAKLAELGASLMVSTLGEWLAGKVAPRPQDESRVTYADRLTKEQGEIDWRRPADYLWRQVRAFQPWPGAYTNWRGRMLKLIAVEPQPAGSTAPPPGFVALSTEPGLTGGREKVFTVQTGQGLLVIRRLQLEGRRVTTAEEFLAGHAAIVGDVLRPPADPPPQ